AHNDCALWRVADRHFGDMASAPVSAVLGRFGGARKGALVQGVLGAGSAVGSGPGEVLLPLQRGAVAAGVAARDVLEWCWGRVPGELLAGWDLAVHGRSVGAEDRGAEPAQREGRASCMLGVEIDEAPPLEADDRGGVAVGGAGHDVDDRAWQ